MLCLRPSPPASDFGAGDTWACGAGGRAQMASGDRVLTLIAGQRYIRWKFLQCYRDPVSCADVSGTKLRGDTFGTS